MLFKNIIGQDHIKARLIRSVKENRVSHAQLFLGPEGSGKLALAIAYAQYIGCEDKKEDDSCGVCRSCVKFEKLAHPDLHFLYPISATKDKPLSANYLSEWRSLFIENKGYVALTDWYDAIGMENKQGLINANDCNEVIKTLSLKSYESEYKIMIIWMIEKLFHAAAPKLLKILEEPPDKTLFILISENHEQVISTILSRTQIIKIPRIQNKDLMHALVHQYELSPKKANEIIRVVEGNYIEAALLAGNPADDIHFNLLRDWMRLCYRNSVTELVEWVEKFSKAGREKQKSFLLNAIRVFRECMLISTGEEDLVKAEGEELKFATDFSPFINSNNTVQIIQEFNEAIFHIERNAHPKILFLDLSLKMTELIKIKV
jgi:DNA polymerase III subunit delta'